MSVALPRATSLQLLSDDELRLIRQLLIHAFLQLEWPTGEPLSLASFSRTCQRMAVLCQRRLRGLHRTLVEVQGQLHGAVGLRAWSTLTGKRRRRAHRELRKNGCMLRFFGLATDLWFFASILAGFYSLFVKHYKKHAFSYDF